MEKHRKAELERKLAVGGMLNSPISALPCLQVQ